jgi:hypothetical protein
MPIKGKEKKMTLTKKGEFLAVARTEGVTVYGKRRILPLGSEATFNLRKVESKLVLIFSVCKKVSTIYKRPVGLLYY